MKNLLNNLGLTRKKSVRVSRTNRRSMVSAQIAKMGQLGQRLVVLSK